MFGRTDKEEINESREKHSDSNTTITKEISLNRQTEREIDREGGMRGKERVEGGRERIG